MRVVLGRGADHRRAADVDQVLRVAAAVLERGRVGAERVEVRHDEVDRVDAVLLHVGVVVGVVAVGEDAAVHLRVQRDDPVAEDRGEAGEVGDVGDRRGRRRASAFAVPPLDTRSTPRLVQRAGQLDDAGLVVHGQQGLHGRHRSSISRMRSDRGGIEPALDGLDALVQRLASSSSGSTGTASWARIGPASTSRWRRGRCMPVTFTP